MESTVKNVLERLVVSYISVHMERITSNYEFCIPLNVILSSVYLKYHNFIFTPQPISCLAIYLTIPFLEVFGIIEFLLEKKFVINNVNFIRKQVIELF